MSESNNYRYFSHKSAKLKDVLSIIRDGGYSNYDDSGTNIIICPECEEWTHVKFNLNSGLLKFLGELVVESIDAEDGNIVLWVKTDEFNWFNTDGERREEDETH